MKYVLFLLDVVTLGFAGFVIGMVVSDWKYFDVTLINVTALAVISYVLIVMLVRIIKRLQEVFRFRIVIEKR